MRLIGAFVAPLATLILLLQFFITPGHRPAEGSGERRRPAHWLASMSLWPCIGRGLCLHPCLRRLHLLSVAAKPPEEKDARASSHATCRPSTGWIGDLLRISLWTGFIFLTLGLLSGAIYTQLFAPRRSDARQRQGDLGDRRLAVVPGDAARQNVFNRPRNGSRRCVWPASCCLL